MKLKKFVKTNSRTTDPEIRLSMKSGCFTITKAACEKIGITPPCKISFFQDEDSPEDWFVCEGDDINCRDDKNSGAVFFNSADLRNRLKKTHNISDRSAKFRIGAPTELEGVNYYPLLFIKPTT